MAIIKRITAQVGTSVTHGTKIGGGFICHHCHRQTRSVVVDGKAVCQLCGKAPRD